MMLTAGVVIVSLSACDSILEVELPGDLTEEALFRSSDSAELLVNSVIADFECSLSFQSAVLSGAEDATWKTSGYWSTFTEYQDQRPSLGSCTENSEVSTDWYAGYQKSRRIAEEAYRYLTEDWADEDVPDRERLIATAATYAGLNHTYLGELFCEYAFPGEGTITPTEMLSRAEQWFTTALDVMGTGDFEIISTGSLKQLALLGRARVRLSMQDYAGAANDASQIQPGFVAWATRDASVRARWNTPYQTFNGIRIRSIAGPVWWYGYDEDQLVSAGYYDLTISETDGSHTVGDGVPDPRVPVEFTGEFALDGVTDQYNQLKYNSQSDPQAIAKWEEAQLILAEIEGGQDAVDRINAIRDENGLPNFQSTDEDEIFSAIVEERRREFFMEGRHYADKLRYGLWFPRGRGYNHKQVRYGFTYCLLMPEDAYELNENIDPGYTGPDLSDLNYTFELQIDRTVNWPVPSSLP